MGCGGAVNERREAWVAAGAVDEVGRTRLWKGCALSTGGEEARSGEISEIRGDQGRSWEIRGRSGEIR